MICGSRRRSRINSHTQREKEITPLGGRRTQSLGVGARKGVRSARRKAARANSIFLSLPGQNIAERASEREAAESADYEVCVFARDKSPVIIAWLST
jgi:hypothetical protein